MALHTQFHRKLDKLWERRTDDLRALIKPKIGMRLGFTRKLRDKVIGELLDIATDILIRKVARSEFARVLERRRLHRLKGHGPSARGADLVRFAKRHSGPIVYAFWRGKTCLYVGKGKRTSRLNGHEKSYGRHADSVEVFFVKTKGQLPKVECLATHMFEPNDYKVKPARVKWGGKCPVCRRHDEIKHLLATLFPMR